MNSASEADGVLSLKRPLNGDDGEHEQKHIKIENQDEPSIVVADRDPVLTYVPLKTGLCYDVRMRYHAKIFTSYFEYIDPHPEDPRRIYRIYKILAENGLVKDPTLKGADDIGDLMQKIPVREATAEEILQVHSEDHLKFLESTAEMSKEQLLEETEKADSAYFNHDSYLGAKLSCGGAIEACKAVVEGRVKNSLAVVRPPGHHAEPDTPGGFCLFSNVAVAAKNILKNYPESVRKIVVVDWDVHHGNGTQKCFIDDPRVLYISLHRFEQGKYYPGTLAGGADQCGIGPGLGFNLNIPWPIGGMGDGDYLYAFEKVIMPICYEFSPDLVIISSGFDAADGDVIGGCHVTPTGYGHMTSLLKTLAKGSLCVVLEGGYNLDSIANSALSVAKCLLGEPPNEVKDCLPKPETIGVVEDVIRIQSSYWKSMKPGFEGVDFNTPSVITNSGNNSIMLQQREEALGPTPKKFSSLQDSIRGPQSANVFGKHDFINLPVLMDQKDEKEVPSIEDQVLASSNIYYDKVVVVSIHDPPEVWSQRDPTTGVLEASSALVMDTNAEIIQWCLKSQHGIIDVNVPVSVIGSTDPFYNNVNAAQEILLYLWDNYIQYFPHLEKLVFVGSGDAYQGVVHLCGQRDVRKLVKASINFLGKHNQLRAVVSTIDESVLDWFYQNSLVFTSSRHPCWAPGPDGEAKRPRKKYGRVLKCNVDGVENMTAERFEEMTDFILDSIEEFESDDDNEN